MFLKNEGYEKANYFRGQYFQPKFLNINFDGKNLKGSFMFGLYVKIYLILIRNDLFANETEFFNTALNEPNYLMTNNINAPNWNIFLRK